MTGMIIRDQDPLKQGLKPQFERYTANKRRAIRDQDPLKQGLKLMTLQKMFQKRNSRARSVSNLL